MPSTTVSCWNPSTDTGTSIVAEFPAKSAYDNADLMRGRGEAMKATSIAIVGIALFGNECCLRAQAPEQAKPTKKTGIELIDAADCSIQSGDSEVRKLQKERLQAAINEWRANQKKPRERWGSFTDTPSVNDVQMGQRLVVAALALAQTPAERIEVRTQHVAYAKASEQRCLDRFNSNATGQHDLELETYVRLDSEINLMQLGGTIRAKRPNLNEERAAQPDQIKPRERVNLMVFAIDPTDPELRRLVKQRANCANTEYTIRRAAYWANKGDFHSLIDAAKRARDCQLDLAGKANRLAILKQYLDFQDDLKKYHLERWVVGSIVQHFVEYTIFERLSAQIDVLRITSGAPTVPFPPPSIPAEPGPFGDDFKKPIHALARDFVLANSFTIDESEPELRRLFKERVNCAIREMRGRYENFCSGREPLDTTLDNARRTCDVRIELAADASQKLTVLNQYFDFLRSIESLNKARHDVGAIHTQDMEHAHYERLTAEIELLQAKAK
jgi:hypothetical protein